MDYGDRQKLAGQKLSGPSSKWSLCSRAHPCTVNAVRLRFSLYTSSRMPYRITYHYQYLEYRDQRRRGATRGTIHMPTEGNGSRNTPGILRGTGTPPVACTLQLLSNGQRHVSQLESRLASRRPSASRVLQRLATSRSARMPKRKPSPRERLSRNRAEALEPGKAGLGQCERRGLATRATTALSCCYLLHTPALLHAVLDGCIWTSTSWWWRRTASPAGDSKATRQHRQQRTTHR